MLQQLDKMLMPEAQILVEMAAMELPQPLQDHQLIEAAVAAVVAGQHRNQRVDLEAAGLELIRWQLAVQLGR